MSDNSGPSDLDLEGPPWARVARMAVDQFPQSEAVANLAVQLCALRKQELRKQWEAEDKSAAHERSKLAGQADKIAKFDEAQAARFQERNKLLQPIGYLEAAWTLLEAAREVSTRFTTPAEAMDRGATDEEAIAAELQRLSAAKVVPLELLCNKTAGSKKYVTVHGHKWRVYHGSEARKGFDLLFWNYWEANATEPPRAADEAKWKRLGSRLLNEWETTGLRCADFLALARFRESRSAMQAAGLLVQKGNSKKRATKSKGRSSLPKRRAA